MIVPVLCLLTAALPQAPAQEVVNYVVSVDSETTGDDVSLLFVLTGPPGSYSAAREGDEILVRIAAGSAPAPAGAQCEILPLMEWPPDTLVR